MENVSLKDATEDLTLTDVGHILLAPLDSEFPDLSKFVFGQESTYGAFKWFGDTSAENLPEFEVEGGEVTSRRTYDRKGQRNQRADRTYTGTFNAVVRNKEFFEATVGGGEWDAAKKAFITKSDSYAKEWMMLIVEEDGEWISGLGLYKVSLLSGFAKTDLENFKEVPVSVAISADSKNRIKADFEPRKKAPVVTPGG